MKIKKRHLVLFGATVAVLLWLRFRRKDKKPAYIVPSVRANEYVTIINDLDEKAQREGRELNEAEQASKLRYEAKLNRMGYTYVQEGTDAYAIPM